jgi:AraC family transcriptional regulator of adaptative response / DNA-3-methyladenine glycosylase II
VKRRFCLDARNSRDDVSSSSSSLTTMSENRETFRSAKPIFTHMDMDADACYRAISMRDARFDGRLFIAVKTTRVYCRPICPARTPKCENCLFFATAAAAREAGFRPCLRCRPETSPELAFWRGTSNTVSRALSLIEAGALDDADVERLAERLGVGGRQLRRLFRQHLGASPITVAQTRRVHLAKQLIHDTHLTMAQVAHAAGFGSIRRFNETFQRLFARPPATLRRRQAQEGGPGTERPLTVKLAYRSPYDFGAMLEFLASRAIPGVEKVEAGRYARTIALGEHHGVLTVEQGMRDSLNVGVHFPRLEALASIIARVRRVFDLATDPQLICAHLSQDELLAPLVAARPGLRVPGGWDGFELAMRAILGQQITVPAASGLAGKLVRAYGTPLSESFASTVEGLTHVFPRPERLIGTDLGALGMPSSRARALSSLAAAVAADPAIFGPSRGLEEAIAKLRSLSGIGEWTAQYIAMRELREPDAFPAADIGLMRALAGPDGRRPTPAELLARAQGWRPWRAYAALHLWFHDSHTLGTAKDAAAKGRKSRKYEASRSEAERDTHERRAA